MHTGAMVALIPTDADATRLAVDGGEPADDLHVTLYYLGKGDDFTAESRAHLTDLVRVHVAALPPVAAEAFAVSAFNPHGDEPAIVLGVGGDTVGAAHTAVCTALSICGADLPVQHMPWCAHLSLAFTDDLSLVQRYADRVGPVTFDRVRVAFAGEHTDIPLVAATPATELPRAALGGTFLRSDSMPDTDRPPAERAEGIQYGRAFIDTSRALTDAAPGSPIPFVASTPDCVRDGIALRASGWTLNNFNANPVFLWCHDYRSEPIGRVSAFTDTDRLRADVTFDQEDERARRIESKYRRGFINAVSVGWDFVDAAGMALNSWQLTPDEMTNGCRYDLLELSGVPVPADPNALVLRQRAALRTLGTELVALFDEQEDPDSDVTAPELRAAVRAELLRLGLDVDAIAGSADEPVGEIREIGPVTAVVDEEALARAIKAAFGDLSVALDKRLLGQPATGGNVTLPTRVLGETGHELIIPNTTTTGVASGGTLPVTWTWRAWPTDVNAPDTTEPSVRAADGPDDEPPTAGVREPADTPVPPTTDSAARTATELDNDAAQVLLAAFTH